MDASFLRSLLRSDFRSFVQKAFGVLNPGVTFHDNWHIGAIAYCLAKMYEPGGHCRQLINMPPRTLKSQMVSVCWPAFLLGLNPAAKIIVVSYTEQLATQLSNDTRRLMQSRFYRELFPGGRVGSPE